MAYYDRNGDLISSAQWGVYFQDKDYQVLRQETIELGDVQVLISTVWLGMDHNFSGEGPPLIFETMVFNEEQPCYRWASEEEALQEHEKLVTEIKLLVEALS